MNARQLSEFATGLEVKQAERAQLETISPILEEGLVSNASFVALHRGSTRVTFPRDKMRVTDFQRDPDDQGMVNPEPGRGVSVNVLPSGVSVADLTDAHKAMVNVCRIRLIRLLKDAREDKDTKAESDLRSNKAIEKRFENQSYMEALQGIASHGVSEFDEVSVPFCYVKIANPFYSWADLRCCPVEGTIYPNPYHCKVELNSPTHVDVIQRLATCSDGDWKPCPFFLKVAGEYLDEPFRLSLERDRVSGVTLTVWDALEYLLKDYEEGGEYIDEQETFEICLYLARLRNGGIRIQQSRFSGLEQEPRLAAFVDLASHCRFYFEVPEDYLIIEHDMAIAFQKAGSGVRLVHSSLVILFDSGKNFAKVADTESGRPKRESSKPQKFYQLPGVAMECLVNLLRTRNLEEICASVREGIRENDVVGWDDFLATLAKSDRISETHSDICRLANILQDRVVVPPFVMADSATALAPYVSESIIEDVAVCLQRSSAVREAVSLILELHLLHKLGPQISGGEVKPRATNFLTAVRSVVDTPSSWQLPGVPPPTLQTPISIGIVSVKADFSDVSKIGVSLRSLVRTLNSAVWRIPASHILWCLDRKSSFNLAQAVCSEISMVDEKQADIWSKTVVEVLKSKLEEANIVERPNGVLRAKDPADSFVLIVAWDSSLCCLATKALVEVGLPRLGLAQPDFYSNSWTVDMRSRRLLQ